MKQISQTLIALSLILITLAGCAVTDIDATADFGKYKTFSWGKSEIKVDNPLFRGGLIDKKIKEGVETEFRKIGILRDERGGDFQVSYKTYTEQKQRRSTTGAYFGYSPFFYRYGFYPFGYGIIPAWSYPGTETYTEGTLILDITDARTNELIWRGSISGEIDQTSNIEKLIRKGVKAIIKKYPVRDEDVIEKGSGTPAIS